MPLCDTLQVFVQSSFQNKPWFFSRPERDTVNCAHRFSYCYQRYQEHWILRNVPNSIWKSYRFFRKMSLSLFLFGSKQVNEINCKHHLIFQSFYWAFRASLSAMTVLKRLRTLRKLYWIILREKLTFSCRWYLSNIKKLHYIDLWFLVIKIFSIDLWHCTKNVSK